MKKVLFLRVWLVLIILTLTTALVSNSALNTIQAAMLILGLSIIKFLGVSFYFMELRKAHIFWKASILFYVLIFFIITISIL
jgi:hypothetical protein